jgi:hypothetical protein
MSEIDFDRSQPPIFPAPEVWIAEYKQKLADEQMETPVEVEIQDTVRSQQRTIGQFAGEAVLVEFSNSEGAD